MHQKHCLRYLPNRSSYLKYHTRLQYYLYLVYDATVPLRPFFSRISFFERPLIKNWINLRIRVDSFLLHVVLFMSCNFLTLRMKIVIL